MSTTATAATWLDRLSATLGFDPRQLAASGAHERHSPGCFTSGPAPITDTTPLATVLTDEQRRYYLRGIQTAAHHAGVTVGIINYAIKYGQLTPIYADGTHWFDPADLARWHRERTIDTEQWVVGIQFAAEYVGHGHSYHTIQHQIEIGELRTEKRRGTKQVLVSRPDLDALRERTIRAQRERAA